MPGMERLELSEVLSPDIFMAELAIAHGAAVNAEDLARHAEAFDLQVQGAVAEHMNRVEIALMTVEHEDTYRLGRDALDAYIKNHRAKQARQQALVANDELNRKYMSAKVTVHQIGPTAAIQKLDHLESGGYAPSLSPIGQSLKEVTGKIMQIWPDEQTMRIKHRGLGRAYQIHLVSPETGLPCVDIQFHQG